MNAISFSLEDLQNLSQESQRAAISAGLEAGLYDVEQAAAYCALCDDQLQAARYAVQYESDEAAAAYLNV